MKPVQPRQFPAICLLLPVVAVTVTLFAESGKPASETRPITLEVVRATDYLGTNGHALVIGINGYADPSIPPLEHSERDAQTMYNCLTNAQVCGVAPDRARLLLGTEASTKNIRHELEAMQQVPASAPVYVYFCGHQVEDGKKRYWLTQDSRLESLATGALNVEEMRERIGKIGEARVVLVQDGPFTAVAVKSGRKTMQDAGSFLEHFISRPDTNEKEATSKRTKLAGQVVEGLSGAADSDGDGIVTLAELTGYMQKVAETEPSSSSGGGKRPTIGERMMGIRVSIHADRILKKLLEAAERERQAKITALLGTAKTNDNKENHQTALAALDQLLALEPKHAEANALRQRIRADQDRELSERERQAKIAALLDTAKTNDNKENRQTALAALDQLLTLEPKHAEASALRQRIRTDQDRELSERERQAKIAALLGTAKANEDKEHRQTALNTLDELLSLDASNTEAMQLRQKIAAYSSSALPRKTISKPVSNRIATVNLQKIFDQYHKTKQADKVLKDSADAYNLERKSLIDEFQKLQSGTFPDKLAQSDEVRKKKNEIDDFDRVRRAQLQDQSNRMKSSIVHEITQTIARAAGGMDYSMILDTSGASMNGTAVVMDARGTTDLTDETIRILNNEISAYSDRSPGPPTGRIATVNLQRVFERYRKTNEADQTLKDAASSYTRDRQQLIAEFQKIQEERDKLVEEVKNAGLSAAARANNSALAEAKLNELRKKKEAIEEFDRTRRQQLQDQSNRMRTTIVKEITDTIERNTRDKDFSVILDASGATLNGTAFVVDAGGAIDLTDETIRILNKEISAYSVRSTKAPAGPIAAVNLQRVFERHRKTSEGEQSLKEAAKAYNLERQRLIEQQKGKAEIEEFDRVRRKQVQDQSSLMRSNIVHEITQVITKAARTTGYSVILDTSGASMNGTPVVVDYRGAVDMTDEIIELVNGVKR